MVACILPAYLLNTWTGIQILWVLINGMGSMIIMDKYGDPWIEFD
jgi:hypothetical protein